MPPQNRLQRSGWFSSTAWSKVKAFLAVSELFALLCSTLGANKCKTCAYNLQVYVMRRRAQMGFYVFVWVHTEETSIVGWPGVTPGTIWGFSLWCVPSSTAWCVSAGEPGRSLANLSVQFPHFPPFSICLLRISTFSTRPANKPLTLKTNTSSTVAGKERNAVFVFQEHSMRLAQ